MPVRVSGPPLFVLFIYIQELGVFKKNHLMSIITRGCVYHPNDAASEDEMRVLFMLMLRKQV